MTSTHLFSSHGRSERARTPDLVPVLTRGKHRSPRKGACFMEFASFLAGERWSDHPRCTDPVLAGLARSVNDHVGDAARHELVPLVPEVVGMVSRRRDSGVRIARHCALVGLPIVPESRQRVLALGLLRCEQVLSESEAGTRRGLSPEAQAALDGVPHAHRWAVAFRPHASSAHADFLRVGVPTIVETAVDGISQGVVPDWEAVLVRLMRDVMAACPGWFGDAATPAALATPRDAEPPREAAPVGAGASRR